MYSFLPYIFGTFLLYYIVPKRLRWAVLLAGSYLFYFASSRWMIVFILGSTLSIYFAGLRMQRLTIHFKLAAKDLPREEKKPLKAKLIRHKKWVVAATLVFNFGILFVLKYFNFFSENVNALVSVLGTGFLLPTFKLAMPLGISFYTLQAVSYVIDVYRGKYEADRNLGRVALFVSFFPQITQGPIGRYDLLAHQLYEGHRFDYCQICYGLQLMVWGMFQKIVIADRINPLVNTVFSAPGNFGGVIVIAAVALYTVQIYAEFSGCMNVVTGGAQMMGIQMSKNFERPFFSRSVNEFWRRWHITLGAWLKDYVFYTVTLSKPFSRLSKAAKKHCSAHFAVLLPTALALFFVWFGNGLWHGASWKYIAYGMYYYVIMLAGMLLKPLFHKGLSAAHIREESFGYRLFQIVRTTLIVGVGMLIFRAPNLGTAGSMFVSAFRDFRLSALLDGSLFALGLDRHEFLVILLGVIVLFAVGLMQEKGMSIRQWLAGRPLPLRWAVYLAAVVAVIILGAYGIGYQPPDLIYAQF